MSNHTDSVPIPTDPPLKPKKRQGAGAKQRAKDKFRARKNEEFDNIIMQGVFSRLKITDPTSIPAITIPSEIPPVTAPVTLKHVPDFVAAAWERFEAVGTRPFATVNNPENRAIFTKGVMVLAEAKVCAAQRSLGPKPDRSLRNKDTFTLEQLDVLAEMGNQLPLPIAIGLEQIGKTTIQDQPVLPTLPSITMHGNRDETVLQSYAPTDLLPYVELAAAGHREEDHVLIRNMQELPFFDWELYEVHQRPPAEGVVHMTRMTNASVRVWGGDPGDVVPVFPRWQRDRFMKIVATLRSLRGYVIDYDLRTATGDPSQVVRFHNWRPNGQVQYHVNTKIPEYSKKIAAALGLGDVSDRLTPSRWGGDFKDSYERGHVNPARVINAVCELKECY